MIGEVESAVLYASPAGFLITLCSRFSKEAESKPQTPPRSTYSGAGTLLSPVKGEVPAAETSINASAL